MSGANVVKRLTLNCRQPQKANSRLLAAVSCFHSQHGSSPRRRLSDHSAGTQHETGETVPVHGLGHTLAPGPECQLLCAPSNLLYTRPGRDCSQAATQGDFVVSSSRYSMSSPHTTAVLPLLEHGMVALAYQLSRTHSQLPWCDPFALGSSCSELRGAMQPRRYPGSEVS